MSIARSVADVLVDHTGLELECVDRMLNVYVPLLQSASGVTNYLRDLRDYQVPYSGATLRLCTGASVAVRVVGLPAAAAGDSTIASAGPDGAADRRLGGALVAGPHEL